MKYKHMKKKLSLGFTLITIISFSQNNAQFITQTIPMSVNPNEQFIVLLTFKNIGTTNWEIANLYI